jgi:phospholipid transport system substrate-binding protein
VHAIDRRALLLGACAAAGATLVVGAARSAPARAAPEHPAVAKMRVIAADLVATQRSGTAAAYYKMISRHADVPSIALYALGPYRGDLKRSQQAEFFRGVGMFIARYFADQAREYPVVQAEISPSVRPDDDEVLVHSTVRLASGSSYTVVWRLADAGGDYKVRDVQVLGFSLRYLKRSMFQSYIARRGGAFQALFVALTQ